MKKILIALLATAFAAPAFAADNYVSASVGHAKQKFNGDGFSISEKDTGFKAAVGHNFMPGVGLELGYASFGEARVSDGTVAAWAKPKTVYAAVVGEVPLTPQFSVTGKAGIARTKTKVGAFVGSTAVTERTYENSPVVGVGAAYALTDNVKLVAEYENYGKIIDEGSDGNLKADMVSVGLRLAF